MHVTSAARLSGRLEARNGVLVTWKVEASERKEIAGDAPSSSLVTRGAPPGAFPVIQQLACVLGNRSVMDDCNLP